MQTAAEKAQEKMVTAIRASIEALRSLLGGIEDPEEDLEELAAPGPKERYEALAARTVALAAGLGRLRRTLQDGVDAGCRAHGAALERLKKHKGEAYAAWKAAPPETPPAPPAAEAPAAAETRTAWELAGDKAYAEAIAAGMSPEEAGELARAASAEVEGSPYKIAEVGTETRPLTDGNGMEAVVPPTGAAAGGSPAEGPRLCGDCGSERPRDGTVYTGKCRACASDAGVELPTETTTGEAGAPEVNAFGDAGDETPPPPPAESKRGDRRRNH
jgi:hypothetical protein